MYHVAYPESVFELQASSVPILLLLTSASMLSNIKSIVF
jgi:hypothetical protein